MDKDTRETTHSRSHRLRRAAIDAGRATLAGASTLVRAGNAYRVVVRDERGRTSLDVPLTLGVLATLIEPVWTFAAVTALLAGGSSIAIVPRASGSA